MVDYSKHAKSIQRRFHNVSYDNAPFPQGYEETEERYRKFRDLISLLQANIERFTHYEHGGKTMKAFTETINKIGDKFSAQIMAANSMYEELGMIIKTMGDMQDGGSYNQSIGRCFTGVASAKVELNRDLDKANAELKKVAVDVDAIDNLRVLAKNARYDLAKLQGRTDSSADEIRGANEEFQRAAENALVNMRQFIDPKRSDEITKHIADSYQKFVAKVQSEFSNLK